MSRYKMFYITVTVAKMITIIMLLLKFVRSVEKKKVLYLYIHQNNLNYFYLENASEKQSLSLYFSAGFFLTKHRTSVFGIQANMESS